MGNIQNRLAAFVHGLTVDDNQKTLLPDITDGTADDFDDLVDFATPEAIESSQHADAGEETGDSETEPIRLINGALDFVGGIGAEVIDEATEFFDHTREDHSAEPETEYPALRMVSVGSGAWSPTRFSVDRSMQVTRKNVNRRLARFVNYGPEVVYLSNTSFGSGVSPNKWSVPISKSDGSGPYSPVEIPTTDEIWAAPTTPGTASILESMEVFGDPTD